MVNQLVKTDQVELLPEEVRKFIDPQGHGTSVFWVYVSSWILILMK